MSTGIVYERDDKVWGRIRLVRTSYNTYCFQRRSFDETGERWDILVEIFLPRES